MSTARAGIERADLYAGRLTLELSDLAEARGRERSYPSRELMCDERSVYPPFEDTVTLAVNAVRRLLSPEETHDIELLIVATESAVDFGKPVSTWVHRLCELPSNCRNFEVKHACYGATAALRMATGWLLSEARPGARALVVSADLSRYQLGTAHEYVFGGCAVAMLVSRNPELLALHPGVSGYWTREIADSFRPTARHELGNGELSIFSYLDALEGAFEHYVRNGGAPDLERDFRRNLYHAPFPAMALQAHRTLLRRGGVSERARVQESFEQRVRDGLRFARRIGSAYGASNLVCLLGMLDPPGDLAEGDRLSVFSYGSGCQGEFYDALLGPGAQQVGDRGIARHLDARLSIDVPAYEMLEQAREAVLDAPVCALERWRESAIYRDAYAGQGLLVLQRIDDFRRTYGWS